MATPGSRRGAGALIERVGFEEPVAGSDGGGGTLDGFLERFSCRAAYVHLRGGETVLAARLSGQHSQIVRVRSSSDSRAVTTDWRIVDRRAGTVFNIRDVTPTTDRAYIDFLCQSGVAT